MLSYRSRSHSGWSAALSTLMFSTGLMLVSSTVLRSPPPSPSRQPTKKTDLIHWHCHSVLLFCSSFFFFFFFFFFSHPPTTSSFFLGGGVGYLLDYILKTPFFGVCVGGGGGHFEQSNTSFMFTYWNSTDQLAWTVFCIICHCFVTACCRNGQTPFWLCIACGLCLCSQMLGAVVPRSQSHRCWNPVLVCRLLPVFVSANLSQISPIDENLLKT